MRSGAAQQAWATLPAETKALVEAYTAGINAFIAEGNTLPPEFTVLRISAGIDPTVAPWTGPDVLVWAKMMAWDLVGNYTWRWDRMHSALLKHCGGVPDGGNMPIDQGVRAVRQLVLDGASPCAKCTTAAWVNGLVDSGAT